MYFMPMLLPYIMFSMWLDMISGKRETHHPRDPLADKGAGSIAPRALIPSDPSAIANPLTAIRNTRGLRALPIQ
jgi:hypothetical protein